MNRDRHIDCPHHSSDGCLLCAGTGWVVLTIVTGSETSEAVITDLHGRFVSVGQAFSLSDAIARAKANIVTPTT